MTHKTFTGSGTPPDPETGLPPDNLLLQRMIEEGADVLLDECRNPGVAANLIAQHDLAETDLLANMMQAVAEWTGRTSSGAEQIKKLHNLLADAMQTIATKEAEKWKR